MRSRSPIFALSDGQFDIAAPGNATAVSIEVSGWLAEALPDERSPEPFAVRTEDAPIPG